MKKAERRNITQPPDWWREFELQAERDGVDLSGWVGECCRANLTDAIAARLSFRTPRGRPRRQHVGGKKKT